MEYEPDEHFRIFFWQKFIPLLGLPVLAAPLAISPLTDGWTLTSWCIAGGLVVAAVGAYLWRSWLRADVVLDSEGLHAYIDNQHETWRWEKLLQVKQVGQYRVRLCYDVDRDDGQHMHVSLDMRDSDAFTDALLDHYWLAQGEELGDSRAHAA